MNATKVAPQLLRCGPHTLGLQRPLVMGIVNVTPDSFSDGGQFFEPGHAIAHARQLIEEGADILDIGGESTRPGAASVSLNDELRRVIPVIEGLRDAGVPISIDTQKAQVMQAAISAGATMVNDVNALRGEGAIATCSSTGVAVCLMHMQGAPQSMQAAPQYESVVDEVLTFLLVRAAACEVAGIARDRIVIDPGFGFGKSLAHNLELLIHTNRFATSGYPCLVGLSRKSMFAQLFDLSATERLVPSVVAALRAVEGGARIVRVHDVKQTCHALKLWARSAQN